MIRVRLAAMPIVAAACVLTGGHPRAESVTVRSEGQSNIVIPVPPSGVAGPDRPTAPDNANQVDERPIWQLLHDHRLTEAQAHIEQLQRLIPNWRPSADLAAEVARQKRSADTDRDGVLAKKLGRALDMGDAASTRRITEQISAEALARQDGAAALTIGWALLKDDKSDEAIRWFRRAQAWGAGGTVALDGLASAYSQSGDVASLQNLANTAPDLRARFLALAADAAGRKGDRATELALIEEAMPFVHDAQAATAVAWSLYHLGRAADAANRFAALFREAPTPDHAAGLVFSHVALGQYRDVTEAARRTPALAQALTVACVVVPGDTDLGYQFYAAWLGGALSAGDDAALDEIEPVLEAAVRARADGKLAANLGWAALHRHHRAAAIDWFAFARTHAPSEGEVADDALFGEQLARLENGESDAVAILTRARMSRSERWRRLYADAEAALGWRFIDRREPSGAATAFEAAYEAQRSETVARGLVLALDQENDEDRLELLAGRETEPIAAIANETLAERAFREKRFSKAATIAPDRFPQLAGINALQLNLGSAGRFKSGDPGTSRLDTLAAHAEASIVIDGNRFAILVTGYHMDSGSPRPTELIGTVGATTRPSAIQSRATRLDGVEPSISWRREGRLTPDIELGLTSINAVVEPTIQGHIELTATDPGRSVSGALYRDAVTESILALGGMVDPATGRGFGRVLESGGRLSLYQSLDDAWGASVAAHLGWRDGVGVLENRHVGASVEFGRGFQLPTFDYLTIGPSYQFDSFADNLSHFTFGQGGYYSPSSLHKIGAAANFQTVEAADWLIRGRAFVGWQTAREALSPFDPFRSTGPSFPGTAASGVALDADIRGVWRVDDHLMLGFDVSGQKSPAYTEISAMLSLHLSLGARSAVVSRDLDSSWSGR